MSNEEKISLEEEKGKHLSSDVFIVDWSEWEFRVTQTNQDERENGGNSTVLFEWDVDPYIHLSLYLQVMNGKVKGCEEKCQSGKR